MNYRRMFIPNSIVFITIVTSKRRNILIDNIKILRKAFQQAKQKYNYSIIAICVLPNHIHMLIKPDEIKEYPNIIKNIKSCFSQMIDTDTIPDYYLTKSRLSKGEKDIWQRRYYEHTILSENDLNKHIDYIHYNQMKHYKIAPKNYKYSSFNKFVKLGYYDIEWCNFEDKNKINDLDLE